MRSMAAGVAVTRMGAIEAGAGVRVVGPDGRRLDGYERGGWSHF